MEIVNSINLHTASMVGKVSGKAWTIKSYLGETCRALTMHDDADKAVLVHLSGMSAKLRP